MLVLTRRLGEEIVIAGNIRITIVAIQPDRVRLGIQAPAAVCIDRSEVHERRHGFSGEARNRDAVPTP
jgi:carbon storage regulator